MNLGGTSAPRWRRERKKIGRETKKIRRTSAPRGRREMNLGGTSAPRWRRETKNIGRETKKNTKNLGTAGAT